MSGIGVWSTHTFFSAIVTFAIRIETPRVRKPSVYKAEYCDEAASQPIMPFIIVNFVVYLFCLVKPSWSIGWGTGTAHHQARLDDDMTQLISARRVFNEICEQSHGLL